MRGVNYLMHASSTARICPGCISKEIGGNIRHMTSAPGPDTKTL
jgi:hypothetical protein